MYRDALQALVGHTRYTTFLASNPRDQAAKDLKRMLGDVDSAFFPNMEFMRDTIGPFWPIIELVQGDTSTLADAYSMLIGLRKHLSALCEPGSSITKLMERAINFSSGPHGSDPALEDQVFRELPAIIQARWEFMWTDALPAAKMLMPKCARRIAHA